MPPEDSERDDQQQAREDAQRDPRRMESESTPANHWYVAGDVGYVGISDGDYDFIGAAVIPHVAEFSGGLAYFVQAGRRFDDFRLELELGRRTNDADQFGSILDVVPARGSLDATSLMLNAVYDLPIGERVRPYLGAGIGGTRVKADRVRKSVTDPDRTGALFGSDERFSWQVLAGLSWRLDESWSLTFNYRYLDAGDARINYGVGCQASGSNCIFSDELDQEYDAHSLSAGIRYDF
jgi:opacity protein-like surface antigen